MTHGNATLLGALGLSKRSGTVREYADRHDVLSFDMGSGADNADSSSAGFLFNQS